MKDKYPAYISWATFEKIQAMLRDNHAEYDRNKTRGVPRDGAALLHGLVYCGACGHKMVVQYKGGARYLCNFLRQQHGVPVCQAIPTGRVDSEAVAAFFKALAPAELDAFARATAARREADDAALQAQAQQVERLRYRAAWPSGNSIRSIPTIAWSPPSSNGAGRTPCATSATPKPHWPRRGRRWAAWRLSS